METMNHENQVTKALKSLLNQICSKAVGHEDFSPTLKNVLDNYNYITKRLLDSNNYDLKKLTSEFTQIKNQYFF